MKTVSYHTKKAVFFDRDGVINSNKGHYYIFKTKDFSLNDGVVEGLKLLSKADFLLFIVSNQGGIAKDFYTKNDVEKIHLNLQKLLAKEGIHFTDIYYCPHHESISHCKCRKPSPYFIKKAIKKYEIDKEKSWMIGDSPRDIEAAERAGIRGIKIISNENILKYCRQIIDTNQKQETIP